VEELEVKKTLKFKAKPLSNKDGELLNYLITEYNKLVRKCLLYAKYSRIYVKPSKSRLHKLTYTRLRCEFDLHSNHITSARDMVIETIKASAYHKVFPNPKRLLPVRLFRGKTYCLDSDGLVRIVVKPRIYAYIRLLGAEEWFRLLELARGALLIKKDNEYYLHVVLKKEFHPPKSIDYVIGIDTNLDNLTLSCINVRSGEVIVHHNISLRHIVGKRIYYRNRRARLQSIGKSTQKESAVCRVVLEQVVEEILKFVRPYMPKCIVAIEELKGIRDKLIKRSKRKDKKYLYSTTFYKRLLKRIKEKLEWEGIRVVEVSPEYTSIICSNCGRRGYRCGKMYSCPYCGLITNADLNASINIAKRAIPQFLPSLKQGVSVRLSHALNNLREYVKEVEDSCKKT